MKRIFNIDIELDKWILNSFFRLSLFAFVWAGTFSFAQGPSLTPFELKESYLDKKSSYQRSSTKEINNKNQENLDAIVEILKENAPNSYEYHYVKYINGNFDLSLKNHLFKAYELKPDGNEISSEMFGYYSLIGNATKQKEFAQRIKNNYTNNTLDYYQSLINTTTAKFYVFSGEKDAYPALVLQSLGMLNKSITIINLDFLQNDSYRKQIQSKVGGFNIKFKGNEAVFLAALLSNRPKEVLVSTTVNQNYLRNIADKCFLVGLTYHINSSLDQKNQLINFWNTNKKDLLNKTISSSSERNLYGNYLPPLLTLYKLKLAEKEKDIPLKKEILQLAKALNKEKQVNEILKAYEQIE